MNIEESVLADFSFIFVGVMSILAVVALIIIINPSDFEKSDPHEVTIESVICAEPDHKGRSECQLIVRSQMPAALSMLEEFQLPPDESEKKTEEVAQ